MLKTIRKITAPDYSVWLLVWLLLIILNTGCNTRIEGCLDVNAKNFDLNGERPCDDCCTYPSMQLSLTQKWDDRNFANTDTLFDSNLDSFKITDLRYFLTSWSWIDEDGNQFTVDSVEGDCNGSTLGYTPDILIIDTRKFLYTLGTIRVAPNLVSIHATLGLTEDYTCLDETDPMTPAAVTDQSPLWNNQSGKLETIRLIVQRNLAVELLDTIYVDLHLENTIPYDVQLANGKDTPLALSVNYAQWFKDVDVNDLSSFETSMLNNIAGSIIPTP
ncbi:MAG: hypothetical protein KBA14_00505 [Saprospiraceae bacterium]|nr:hypothetical protein [Saprospiraceae bacterium]